MNDLSIQFRIDRRHLATFLRFCQQEGKFIKSRSELARLAVTTCVDILVQNGIVEMINYSDEASRYLINYFQDEKILESRNINMNYRQNVLNQEQMQTEIEKAVRKTFEQATPTNTKVQEDNSKIVDENYIKLLREQEQIDREQLEEFSQLSIPPKMKG